MENCEPGVRPCANANIDLDEHAQNLCLRKNIKNLSRASDFPQRLCKDAVRNGLRFQRGRFIGLSPAEFVGETEAVQRCVSGLLEDPNGSLSNVDRNMSDRQRRPRVEPLDTNSQPETVADLRANRHTLQQAGEVVNASNDAQTRELFNLNYALFRRGCLDLLNDLAMDRVKQIKLGYIMVKSCGTSLDVCLNELAAKNQSLETQRIGKAVAAMLVDESNVEPLPHLLRHWEGEVE